MINLVAMTGLEPVTPALRPRGRTIRLTSVISTNPLNYSRNERFIFRHWMAIKIQVINQKIQAAVNTNATFSLSWEKISCISLSVSSLAMDDIIHMNTDVGKMPEIYAAIIAVNLHPRILLFRYEQVRCPSFASRNTPDPYHPRRRRNQAAMANRPPQMKAIGVVVDMLGLGRMELHNAVLRPPEGILDPAHFLPCRTPFCVLHRNADVFPSHAITGDDEQADIAMLDDEVAVVAVGSGRSAATGGDAAVLWNLKHVTPPNPWR